MNLVILFEDDFTSANRVRLTGRRCRHLREVHGAEPGRTLRVGLLDGPMGTGIVTAINERAAELDVRLAAEPPAPLPLTLVLALPRPKMLRRIFRTVAELGIQRLWLINSWRVEKSYWSTPVLAPDNYRRYLIEGLEQARDTRLPQVEYRRLFKPFVEDELPALAAGTTALLAHPGAGRQQPRQPDAPVTLAIGPEGGFIEYEVDKLITAGFTAFDMGPRIYRVENAITAAVARLYES